MSRPGKPARFKPSQPAPMAVSAQKSLKIGNFRGSPRERGYDSKWDRISLAYRKSSPFCEWCENEGGTSLVDVVDHIIPVADRPDLIHTWKNLMSLCKHHHGLKYSLEIKARGMGDISLLKLWVKDPKSIP